MTLKHHIQSTAKLAWPLIISQIGHILTGIVDTIFLGKLGTVSSTAQAAGVLANQLFVVLLVFGIGVSYALTPKVTDADANSNNNKKASLLKNAIIVNLFLSLTLFVLLFLATPLLSYMQQSSDVVDMAKPFFKILTLSIIPLSLFFVGKQYCEGLSNTKIAMIISIVGNLLNVVLNYAFIFGKFGFSEMGYMGSCWATFVARCFMGVAFIFILYYHKRFDKIGKLMLKEKINLTELKDLFFSGLASGFQFSFEIAAFLVAALMVGSFGKEELVAHGIAMHFTSITYMFGSGIGGAAMIRVSSFYAKKDFTNLRLANKASFIIVWVVMGGMALIFFALNKALPTNFTQDIRIIGLASILLLIAGLFQLFDGMQVTSISILRGLEDYKIPTIITLVAYWIVAIPLAYLFAFTFKMEAIGVWIALCIGLVLIGVSLFLRINYLYKKMNVRN